MLSIDVSAAERHRSLAAAADGTMNAEKP